MIDGLLRKIPQEIGVKIDEVHYNAFAFADDLIFVASTPQRLQTTLDTAAEYLTKCGLAINAGKSFIVTIQRVSHMKKTVIGGRLRFKCAGSLLPALQRADEWRYLGVPFTSEDRSKGNETKILKLGQQKLA